MKVLILGAGKIGAAIARFLGGCGDYEVLVGDFDELALHRLHQRANVNTSLVDVSNRQILRDALKGCDAVVSACSFSQNLAIAQAALDMGPSYFDLTEDLTTARAIRRLAVEAVPGQIFMPQCGLAPGFVSIAANHLAQQFDSLDSISMRVGALPQFPTNQIKYNLTWSTDGLINEYGNACEAIHESKLVEMLPLEGLEHFSLDGVDYEAFNTSGGVGTLCETLLGKVRTLNYKTIRYRGHRELMTFLLNDLRLNDRRPLLKEILENAVPITPQDVVLIFVTVSGQKAGHLTQITDARKIYHGQCMGESWSAIQITTASSLCAVVDLWASGRLPDHGFVRQEQVDLDEFLANRFGKCYDVAREEHFSIATRVQREADRTGTDAA